MSAVPTPPQNLAPSGFRNWVHGVTEAITVLQDGHVHHQPSASDEWVIQHNLGTQYPNVTVFDSSKRVVFGDIEYVDENSLVVSFSAPFSGYATLR